MARTLAMRATSLAASTALLALAGFAAVSLSYTVVRFIQQPETPPIVSIEPPVIVPPAPTPHAPHAPPTDATTPAPNNDAPVKATPISADPGVGATPDPGPAIISNPHWLRRPTDLTRYYPRAAIRREMEGDVLLDCAVSTMGVLQCAVISETPANWGFGAAALAIARDHLMEPATRNGAPVEGRYRMRVPFRLR